MLRETRALVSSLLLIVGVTESALRQSLVVLTSQDRHKVRRPDMREFISQLNSSAFSKAGPGNSHATRKIECETLRILRPGGAAMNCIDQDVPFINTDELSATREDPLVTAVQAGVPEAFAQLHAIYSSRLYRTIIAITKNPEDTQDALQETFLRAHLSIYAFEGRSSIYSWLNRIAINSALVILRKRRTHHEVLFDPQPDNQCEPIFFEAKDPAPNPEEAYDLYERQIKTLDTIRCLNPKLQAPIRMQMKHGWSVREIGEALNISDAAAKSRLYRARQRLSKTHADQRHFAAHRRQPPSARAGRDFVLPAFNHGKC